VLPKTRLKPVAPRGSVAFHKRLFVYFEKLNGTMGDLRAARPVLDDIEKEICRLAEGLRIKETRELYFLRSKGLALNALVHSYLKVHKHFSAYERSYNPFQLVKKAEDKAPVARHLMSWLAFLSREQSDDHSPLLFDFRFRLCAKHAVIHELCRKKEKITLPESISQTLGTLLSDVDFESASIPALFERAHKHQRIAVHDSDPDFVRAGLHMALQSTRFVLIKVIKELRTAELLHSFDMRDGATYIHPLVPVARLLAEDHLLMTVYLFGEEHYTTALALKPCMDMVAAWENDQDLREWLSLKLSEIFPQEMEPRARQLLEDMQKGFTPDVLQDLVSFWASVKEVQDSDDD